MRAVGRSDFIEFTGAHGIHAWICRYAAMRSVNLAFKKYTLKGGNAVRPRGLPAGLAYSKPLFEGVSGVLRLCKAMAVTVRQCRESEYDAELHLLLDGDAMHGTYQPRAEPGLVVSSFSATASDGSSYRGRWQHSPQGVLVQGPFEMRASSSGFSGWWSSDGACAERHAWAWQDSAPPAAPPQPRAARLVARYGVLTAWLFALMTPAALALAVTRPVAAPRANLALNIVFVAAYASFLAIYVRVRPRPSFLHIAGVASYTLGYACFALLFALALARQTAGYMAVCGLPSNMQRVRGRTAHLSNSTPGAARAVYRRRIPLSRRLGGPHRGHTSSRRRRVLRHSRRVALLGQARAHARMPDCPCRDAQLRLPCVHSVAAHSFWSGPSCSPSTPPSPKPARCTALTVSGLQQATTIRQPTSATGS